jgi:mannose-6-phosphate isomerase-like protein (cupin superfamily)
MRTGCIVHDGTTFYLHVHVIAASSPEAATLRSFRDRLRSEPGLVVAYVAMKRAIIAEGCTDSVDYSIRKGEFIMQRSEGNNVKGGRAVEKVNLREKLGLFSEQWSPKVVGELNGQQVKLVKFDGPFVWHHHDNEDELFLVVKGRFRMEFRDRHVWLQEGEFLIVPRGVEHRPVAEEEAHVLLFEPGSTLNTGNVRNERTLEHLDRI